MLRDSLLLAAGMLVTSTPASARVRTPFGKRSVADVHPVPLGGEVNIVGDEIHLLDASGNLIHVAPNALSPTATPTDSATNPSATVSESGWVAYAYWQNNPEGPPISWFSTVWEVPEPPSTYDNQTIYLFNSLEPESDTSIFQPVLQYGDGYATGSGDFWAVASWYINGDSVYFTPLIKVHPGDILTGVMKIVGTNGSGANVTYNYTSEFVGLPGTFLKANMLPVLDFASETLEIYNVTTLSDLPSGTTVFRDIQIQTPGGTPNVTWGIVDDPDDAILATVDIQGATGSKVTITY